MNVLTFKYSIVLNYRTEFVHHSGISQSYSIHFEGNHISISKQKVTCIWQNFEFLFAIYCYIKGNTSVFNLDIALSCRWVQHRNLSYAMASHICWKGGQSSATTVWTNEYHRAHLWCDILRWYVTMYCTRYEKYGIIWSMYIDISCSILKWNKYSSNKNPYNIFTGTVFKINALFVLVTYLCQQ